LRRGAFEIERQQALQRVLDRDVFRPAVGARDGAVERVVRVGKPARALVVEGGQRALLELDRGLDILRQDAVGIAARRLAGCCGRRDLGNDVDQVGRIEPGAPQIVERLRGGGDSLRARIGGVSGGGNVGRQAGGEGEGLEGGGWGVARIVADAEPCAEPQRPRFVEAECRMPKVVSSSRAMTVKFLSAPVALSIQTNTRCLVTSGVTIVLANFSEARASSGRVRHSRHQSKSLIALVSRNGLTVVCAYSNGLS
jgi:hypothetical protein